ncbi:MAG: RICIN domain-containing protein, partial [Oscillospiraceae bacterium]|nr:RICIN domain-containing protein [Oscillospiraceae bacterium]
MNSKQHRRALRRRIVTTLAALVVFWTTYALILPAITLEQDQAAEIVAPTEPALCTQVQTADGNHLTVTLRCDSTAGLPDDAVLAAREIPQGTEDYQAAYDEAVRALSDENGVAVLNQLWLLDISVVSGGEKIEPAAAVQVSVEYADPVPAEEDSALQIVHFAGETPEVLEATVAEPDAAEITAFTFETESFSTFAFAKANYIGSLNGQSFAIVRDNGGKVALSSQALDATRLKAAAVTVSGNTLTSDDEITVWTFEHVRDNFYYIKSDDGKYLNLTAASLTAGDTPGLIEVYPIDSSGNTSGYVRLRSAEDSGVVVQNKGGSVSGGFQANRATDNNTRIALYQSVDSSPYPKITAQKRSATELEGGKSYTIYQRVYNSEIGEYENYVVAGDGSLVYAFDDGDYVGYRTDKSTTWYLIEYADEEGNLTGYYDFYNAYTGNYLSPQSGGILSKEPLGLLLSGRGDGDYSTTIEGWDNAAKGYFGYSLDLTNRVLIPGAGQNSTEFSFAEATDFQSGELHPVDTVDSVANGIRIGMYDFNGSDARRTMNLFDDDDWYKNGEFKQGLLKPVLGEDGLPVSRTGRSFSEIYNEKNFKGD